MAARFAHASATPTSIDLALHELRTTDVLPKTQHKTPTGTALRYVHGTRYRRGELMLFVLSVTERDNFLSFHRTVSNVNTRFTFTADITNHASDTWSAFFVTDPVFERYRMGARIVEAVRVVIEDAPVSL